MDFTQMLQQAIMGPAYQLTNPTTTPEDMKRITEAVRLAGPLQGVVRLLENRPDINGMLKSDANLKPVDKDIWVSRQGTNWTKGNPHRVAGTVVHENEHLKGADEITARQRQLQFIEDAIRNKQMKNDRSYVDALRESLATYQWAESVKQSKK